MGKNVKQPSFFTTLIMSLFLFGAVVSTRHYFIHDQSHKKSQKNEMVFALQMKPKNSSKKATAQTKTPLKKVITKRNPQKIIAQKQKATQSKPKVNPNPVIQNASIRKVTRLHNPKIAQYLVKSGDRLDKISMKFYGTHHKYRDILAANPGLNPKNLKVGQKIVIPHINASLPQNEVNYIQYGTVDKRPYTIKANDVLSRIAENELGTIRNVPKILELNPGLNPNKLRPGQTIFLPIN